VIVTTYVATATIHLHLHRPPRAPLVRRHWSRS